MPAMTERVPATDINGWRPVAMHLVIHVVSVDLGNRHDGSPNE